MADRVRHTTERPAVAIPVVVLALVGSIAVAVWIGFVSGAIEQVRDSGFSSSHAQEFGRDFAGFRLAGQRVVDGHGGDIYTIPGDTRTQSREPSRFKNPPFYALFMVPFTALDLLPSYLVWTMLGVLCLSVGTLMLGVRYPLGWLVAILLSMSSVLAVFYGQNSFFTFFLLSASYASLRARRDVAAGSLIGVVAYKPQLLLGFAVWFVVRYHRMWKVIAGAALSVVVLVGTSYLAIPEAWPRFVGVVLTVHPDLPNAAHQLSLRYVTLLLVPQRQTLALAVYLAITGALVAGQVWFLQRVRGDIALEFAAAVAVSVLIAPNGLTYDWVLLAIPLSLVWNRRPELWRTWLWSGAALMIAVLSSVYLAKWQVAEFGIAIQVAPVVLLAVVFIAGKQLAGRGGGADSSVKGSLGAMQEDT